MASTRGRVVPPGLFLAADALRCSVATVGIETAAATTALIGSLMWSVSVGMYVGDSLPTAGANFRVLSAVLYFASAAIILASCPQSEIAASAALQLMGSVLWAATAYPTVTRIEATRGVVIAGVMFFAGAMMSVATTADSIVIIYAWVHVAGALVWVIISEPVLASTQDWWLLTHALFGAVLVTLWAAVLDNATYEFSVGLTFVVAIACRWLTCCIFSDGAGPGWVLNIVSTIVVHALLQHGPATRDVIRVSGDDQYVPFGVAAAAWVATMSVTRCACPNARAPGAHLVASLVDF